MTAANFRGSGDHTPLVCGMATKALQVKASVLDVFQQFRRS